MRGRRINAFRSRGFGHVREYTPVALHRKAAFLRATSQASTARQPPRGRFGEKRDIWDFRAVRNIAFFAYYMVVLFAELATVAAGFFAWVVFRVPMSI